MALCPECGGRISPASLIKLAPRAPMRCRWCRATLQVPLVSQVLSLTVFFGGSLGAALYFGSWYLNADNMLPLIVLAGVVLGLMLLAVLIQWLLPLQTVVPRDFRDWATADPAEPVERAEPAEDDQAVENADELKEAPAPTAEEGDERPAPPPR